MTTCYKYRREEKNMSCILKKNKIELADDCMYRREREKKELRLTP
jgi:hypothetical protein